MNARWFFWRNDDKIWPHGSICSYGSKDELYEVSLQQARQRIIGTFPDHPQVESRVLTEDPVQVLS